MFATVVIFALCAYEYASVNSLLTGDTNVVHVHVLVTVFPVLASTFVESLHSPSFGFPE